MATAFDRYFDERMKKPGFARAYERARAEIDSVDEVMRVLDAARAEREMSKAELARRIDASPVVVRKLLTQPSVNPSFQLVSRLANAVGLRLVLEPAARPSAAKAKKSRRVNARPGKPRKVKARGSAASGGRIRQPAP